MGAPGCDDAPIVTVPLGESPRVFTLIMPYYENPNFLLKQLYHLDVLSANDWFLMQLSIVDDGSPKSPAKDVFAEATGDDLPLHFVWDLRRIEVDVRWNWLAARNIGVHHAGTEWIMLTDMDHMIPLKTARTLSFGKFDPGIIYRFSRTGSKTHPHPNSWFMTRDMYWKVGGYDEALSGYYGTDGEYRRRCARTAPIRIMDVPLELHEHEGDSSTIRYKRKQPEDAAAKQMIRRRGPGWQPRVLSFPYHEVTL